jgi:hypothetical protein
MSKTFTQYFNRYAESEVALLAQHENSLPVEFVVEHALVIPAYQETSAFIKRFLVSALPKQPVLMVVVINEPLRELEKDPDDTTINTQQKQLHQYSLSCGDICWKYENLTLIRVDNGRAWLLVVDRFTHAIDKEQGVGLARKIGADLSAYLISTKRVIQPWICSTDADAHLPDDYFAVLQSINKGTVVCCYNFFHDCEDHRINQANALYETALRYYVAGLNFANSPYAFFTIGSILAFKAEAYVQARGFPKRSAGEDFYLLNKLAKLGDVEFIADVTIKLEARTSQRVPFGTGPAVQKILDLQESNKAYCYYHPEVFSLLKSTLHSLLELWQYRFDLTLWLNNQPLLVHLALTEIGFENFVEKQKNNNEKQFNKQLVVWFDAFKTLKFIHSLRENHYQDIPLTEALLKAPFILK